MSKQPDPNGVTPPKKPSLLKSVAIGFLSYLGLSIPVTISAYKKVKDATSKASPSAPITESSLNSLIKTERAMGVFTLAAGVGIGITHHMKAKKNYKAEMAQWEQMQQGGPNTAQPEHASYSKVAHSQDMGPTQHRETDFRGQEQQRETAAAGDKGRG